MKHAAAAFLLVLTTAAHSAPLAVEDLFKPVQFQTMALSPDGKTIAALAPVAGRQNLVVLDAKTKKPTPVTSFTTRDIVAVDWVNSKRVLVQTGSIGTRAFDARGGGIYAVDIDGGDGRLISEGSDERNTSGIRFTGRALNPVRTLPGESDDIIAQEFVFSRNGATAGDLFRINTRTGRRTSIGFGKPDSGNGEAWIVDRNGVARALSVFSEGKVRIWYRSGPDAKWVQLDERSQTKPGWSPVGLTKDDKKLLVADQLNRDKAALVIYDTETKSFGEVLAAHPQVDLANLVTLNGVVVGVRYDADRAGTAWFDESLAHLQVSIDRAMPGTVNMLYPSRDRSMMLVVSYSDVSPGSFYLFDTKAGKLEWLVDRAPQINPKEMAPMQPVRYRARDGLEIPAYLTLPKNGKGKNLPLVMVVHGGPWVSGDSWSFDREAQFLASRGYAVLQPNFRGTTRYGWKHFSSSFGQWGLAMQDDVTDGVKWAVEQGIADPKRVCIYGASYGGYATMMGLAKDPDLYKCGINYVGVTDVDLFLTATWADYAQSDFIKYTVQEMVGDSSKDAERLKATSPVEQAHRIKAPVLMAYGAADYRVPIEHGQRMRAAMEKNGLKPIWMVADGEGHGFREMANQKMFYEAMAKFLDENIGKP